MDQDEWRKRLRAAIDASGMSDRAVSTAAGKATGYVYSIFNEGKDPSIGNLIAVCKVIGVGLSHVLYGFDMSPETEEILSRLEDDPKQRENLLALLRRGFSLRISQPKKLSAKANNPLDVSSMADI